MRYITDQQASEIPALAELPDSDRQTILADAARVHTYVQRNAWISDEDLRLYGERNDLPPDRLNAALALLCDTGQLYRQEDRPGAVTDAIVEAGSPQPPPVPDEEE